MNALGTQVNRAWSQLFGLTDEEAYGFNVLNDPNIEKSATPPFIRKAFAGEVVYVPPVPFPVRRHSTQIRWIGGTVFPVLSPEGVVQEVVGIHQDITDLKEAETLLWVAKGKSNAEVAGILGVAETTAKNTLNTSTPIWVSKNAGRPA